MNNAKSPSSNKALDDMAFTSVFESSESPEAIISNIVCSENDISIPRVFMKIKPEINPG